MCAQAIEAELLVHGVHYGFRVLPDGKTPADVAPFVVNNYPMPTHCAAALQATLDAECESGALRRTQQRPQYLTALHAKEEKDKIRTLCDYSAPEGKAINDYADARHFTMMSHEDAYALMRPNAYMAKVDIKSAFRTVGVHPSQWCLLAYQWPSRTTAPEAGSCPRDVPHSTPQVAYYLDTRFPFGLKSSPEVFCRLSQAVRAMMSRRGHKATLSYVDDFLVVKGTQEACELAKQTLLSLLLSLGFKLSHNKIEGPTQDIVFLGLRLRTNADGHGRMDVTVPDDKLAEALRRAQSLARAGRTATTLTELESAVGYFQHVAQAIYPARAFLRRLIEAIREAKRTRARSVPLTRSMRLDLQFWAKDAPRYNGSAVLLACPEQAPGFLATDASATHGMGGFYDGHSFAAQWTDLRKAHSCLPRSTRRHNSRKLWPVQGDPQTAHINYKEMFAVWWALLLWGPRWRDRHVTLHCDNETARFCFNKLRATRNSAMMRLIRHTARYLADHNIRLNVVRIPTEANVLADALSRQDFARYQAALAQWRDNRAHEQQNPQWLPRVFTDPPMLEQKAAEYLPCARRPPTAAAAPGGGAC